MDTLTLTPNFDDADDFYAALLAAHAGLDDPETHAFNARLVLIFANHIGKGPVLMQALDAAKKRQ